MQLLRMPHFLIALLPLACSHKNPHLTLVPGKNQNAESNIIILDRQIADAIQRLTTRSALFNTAWQEIRESNLPLIIGTPDQLQNLVPDPLAYQLLDRYGASAFAHDDMSGFVTSAVVSIDVAKIFSYGLERGNSLLARDALDIILIHEIYGHVAPVAKTRQIGSLCPDPEPGQPYANSCVGRREREVLIELGRRARSGYPLDLRAWRITWGPQ